MPEPMEIYLASNNEHKLAEMSRLFEGAGAAGGPGFRVRLPREAGVDFDFEETGETFLENAWGKARALHALVGRPVVADDSGLCVQALGGEPGIRSARYGSGGPHEKLSNPERLAYLLKRMSGRTDRRAWFVCCMVLLLGGDRFLVAQETVHGLLTEAPRGFGGFGYDPIFFMPGPGRTMAELADGEKDLLSHRGRAARRLLSALAAEPWAAEPPAPGS